MIETIQLKGFKEIELALKRLPNDIQKKSITKALNRAASHLVSEARAKCPESAEDRIVRSKKSGYTQLLKAGNLKKSIAWGAGTKYKGRYVRTRLVGIKKKGHYHSAFYGRFVELGHRSRNGKTDVQPHPFLGPAFDSNIDRMIEYFADQLKVDLEYKGLYKYA